MNLKIPSRQVFSSDVELIWRRTTMADMVCCSLWMMRVFVPRGSSSSSSHTSDLYSVHTKNTNFFEQIARIMSQSSLTCQAMVLAGVRVY